MPLMSAKITLINKQTNTLSCIDVLHECIMFKYINIKDIHMIIEMKTKVINKYLTFALKCNQNENLYSLLFGSTIPFVVVFLIILVPYSKT